MPQLRSFSAFAPTPDTGSAFVGGAGVGQRQEESRINAGTARAQMSNQYAIAEMENAAKQQALQMEAMKAAQELEVQRSYQQQSLALKSQELEQGQKEFQLKSDQAASEAQAQAMYQSEVASMMKAGKSPAEATAIGIAKHGMALGERASAPIEQVIRGQQQRGAGFDQAGVPVATELLDKSGKSTGVMVYNSGESWQRLPPQHGQPGGVPPGYVAFTNEMGQTEIRPDLKYKELSDRVQAMNKELKNTYGFYSSGIQAARKATTTSTTLSDKQRGDLDKYLKAVDEVRALQERLDNWGSQSGAATSTNAPLSDNIKAIRLKK